jgi:TRAP-type uncharacterized transport system substrate-binding protein
LRATGSGPKRPADDKLRKAITFCVIVLQRSRQEAGINMTLRIGTAERDSTFLSQGFALKTALERNPALAPVEVSLSAQASVENANRLAVDDIDFGFMASNWIGRAKNGEPPFSQKIDLRMVAPMNAGPLFFITRADSSLRKVTDMRGRRLVVGPQWSGMTQHARHTRHVGADLCRLHAGVSRFRRRRRGGGPRRG